MASVRRSHRNHLLSIHSTTLLCVFFPLKLLLLLAINHTLELVISRMSDYLASSSVNAAKWYWLVDRLNEAAKKRELLNVQVDRTVLVASDTVNVFVNHYLQATPGKTYVCYGVSGCGKTMSAAHLLRGEYIYRPRRAIMVNAFGSRNFVKDFCDNEDAPSAAPHLVDILCTSLIFDDKKQASKAPLTKLRDIFTAVRRMAEGCIAPAAEQPSMELDPARPLQLEKGRPPTIRSELPLLIIDDLAKSEANEDFIARLYIRAHSTKISVLILTKHAKWATEIKNINGGVKILPVDGVVSNPRGDSVKPFVDDPQWTGMTWDLRDLKLFAETLGAPAIFEELRDGMTPEEVVDLHSRRSLTTIP